MFFRTLWLSLVLLKPHPSLADTNSYRLGDQTSGRAVVVIEGGGSTHPFTTPWAACDGGREKYIQALLDGGLPVFTAPGFTNLSNSTEGQTGCPPQPPVEVQWNTSGYPTQSGEAVLGFLGYLHETYGYKTFDLVGYSYGGVIARAAVAALKQNPAEGSMAMAFSYAQVARDSGVKIPSLVTMNSPHFGGPSYDIALDPRKYFAPVRRGWGSQYANNAKALVPFEQQLGAGAIQLLSTVYHASPGPANWDERQRGMLNGVKLTLIAGDYCGRKCPLSGPDNSSTHLRTDGTVPVYSQLMQSCPTPCPNPPKAVYIPQGLIPEENVVRQLFPTVHSTFDAKRLGLPLDLSVTQKPAAINFLVNTLVTTWKDAGIPLLPH